MTLNEAHTLFATALAQVAPDWQIDPDANVPVGIVDPNDPEHWSCGEFHQFGSTIVSKSRDTKLLGKRDTDPPGQKTRAHYSCHPAIPGSALEAFKNENPDPITSYLKGIGVF